MTKRLIAKEHRTKYCNPNSPRHVGHYVSPIPDANSSIYDTELEEYDKDLSVREEKFLLELKHFYEGVEKYEEFKAELDTMIENHQNRVLSPSEIKARLVFIQKMLNDRARRAELIYSQPIPDYSEDAKSVLSLEKEVEDLERLMPKESISETVTLVAQMMLDSQSLEMENAQRVEELAQRQKKIDENIKLFEEEEEEFEKIAQAENILYQQVMDQKSEFEKLPKYDLKEILDIESKKEELEARRRKSILLNKKLKLETKKAKEDADNIQNEINSLQANYAEICSKNSKREAIFSQIKKATEMKSQMDQTLSTADEDLAQLRRKFEIQNEDLEKINSKKANLTKRETISNEKKSKLIEKDKDLKRRRSILDSSEDQFSSIRADLNAMKQRISEADNEVAKYEKLAKSMMDKVNKAQELLENKSIEIVDAPSQQHLDELQNLIAGSEPGKGK